MKKTFLSIAVIFAAAGCTKNYGLNEIRPSDSDIRLYAHDLNAIKSRTTIDDNYQVDWSDGDNLAVYTWINGESLPASDEAWKEGNPVKFTVASVQSENVQFLLDEAISDAGKVTSFRQRYNQNKPLDWYAVYPGFMDTPSAPGKAVVFFGNQGSEDISQHGNSSKEHLPLQDVLFGCVKGTLEPVVSMNHLGALQQISITNNHTEPIIVQSVSMKAENAVLSGKFALDMTSDTPFATAQVLDSSNEYTLKVTDAEAIQPGASAIFYFVTAPFSMTTGDIIISVIADKGECSKTMTVSSNLEFKAGYRYNANFNFSLAAAEILPGRTLDDIRKADVWHYNEYRGGKNGDDYPHFDWSSDYMGTFTSWYGWWEEQNEGTTLQIRNSEDQGHWSNPADLVNFDSYLLGIKDITDDNKILSIKVRTHGADAMSPAKWGVQVIDLTEQNPQAQLVGGIRSYGSNSYSNPDESFDLSAYVGKKVAVAIGIFRAETGNYWKQVVLRRLAFGPRALTTSDEWSYLPGTPVSGLDDGYKMTQEIVRSTMPVTELNSFTGVSSVQASSSNYRDAYKTWRPAGHFAAWWSCMPVKKDSEPFAGEGYVIKTRGAGTTVSTTAPEAYFYAKFAISEGHNMLELNCRTFSSTNATFFKLTAITEDCATVKAIVPSVSVAVSAEQADNGCMKLKHENGSASSPDDYAHFTYDLSEFNGTNVVVALGVFKGEDNGDENKLSIHSINIR